MDQSERPESGNELPDAAFLEHGEILGRDAMMWLPHFTRHQTNHTNLAAGLEKGPSDLRQKSAGIYSETLRPRHVDAGIGSLDAGTGISLVLRGRH